MFRKAGISALNLVKVGVAGSQASGTLSTNAANVLFSRYLSSNPSIPPLNSEDTFYGLSKPGKENKSLVVFNPPVTALMNTGDTFRFFGTQPPRLALDNTNSKNSKEEILSNRIQAVFAEIFKHVEGSDELLVHEKLKLDFLSEDGKVKTDKEALQKLYVFLDESRRIPVDVKYSDLFVGLKQTIQLLNLNQNQR